MRGSVFHASRNGAALLNNLIYEVDRVVGLLQSLSSLIANGFVAAFIVLTAALIDLGITAFAVALLGGGYLLLYALTRRRLIRNSAAQSAFAAERATVAAEAFAAIKELTVWGAQQRFLDRFASACRHMSLGQPRAHRMSGISLGYVLECLAVAGLVTIALCCARTRPVSGRGFRSLRFSASQPTACCRPCSRSFIPAVRVRANFSAFELRRGGSCRRACAPFEAARAPNLPFVRAVSVVNASFDYGNGRSAALRDVSLEIPRGSMIGIVGANGSGKTTLVDLLLGLLSPVSGALTIDGVALAPDRYGSWQSQLAYVPQQIALLDASVADNIAFGRSAEAIEGDAHRCRRAHCGSRRADHFFAERPGGADRRAWRPVERRGTAAPGHCSRALSRLARFRA